MPASKQVFRRNMWFEEGQRHFIVATHDLDPDLITSATPGWLDWDRDGDLDTAIGDISAAFFYENTLYDAATPADQARRTYLFFNNCHAGQAVRNAKLMQELLRQQKLA